MKKSFIYIAPDNDGKIQKSEVLDLGMFRNQQRMQKLADMLGVSFEIGTALLAGKKFDDMDLNFLKGIFEAELKNIEHPIEKYPVTLESFDKVDKALKSGAKIGIYGDYDGDGVTSAIMMYETLKQFTDKEKLVLDFSRVGEDGFGFSLRGAQNLMDNGCGLIFVLDTGSNSEDTLALAAAAGIDVIVIDHHPLGEDANLIEGILYVNPHLHTSVTPNPEELRNAGLVWFYCRSMLGKFEKNMEYHYGYPLAISALGTIADAGSQFEGIYNRGILHEGLSADNLSKIEVFGKLFRINPYEINNDLNAPDVARGFRILSLAKRMKTIIPDVVFRMLSLDSTTDEKFEVLAMLEEKHEVFFRIADEATDVILANLDEKDNIIIEIASTDIVPSDYIGMSGTLASRIMSRVKKPAIIFVKDDDGSLKGSWRTGDIDGGELLGHVKKANPGIIEQFGGHAPAGGLLLKTSKKFFPFKFIVQEQLANAKKPETKQFFDNPNVNKYFATTTMKAKDFRLSAFDRLSAFTPFNRYDIKMPSCFLTDVYVKDSKILDGENHLYFTDAAGTEIDVLLSQNVIPPQQGETVDFLLSIRIIENNEIAVNSDFMVSSQFRMEG